MIGQGSGVFEFRQKWPDGFLPDFVSLAVQVEAVLHEQLWSGFAGFVEHGRGDVNERQTFFGLTPGGKPLVGFQGATPDLFARGAGLDGKDEEVAIRQFAFEPLVKIAVIGHDLIDAPAGVEVVIAFVNDDGPWFIRQDEPVHVIEQFGHGAAAEAPAEHGKAMKILAQVFVPLPDGGTAGEQDRALRRRRLLVGGLELTHLFFVARQVDRVRHDGSEQAA